MNNYSLKIISVSVFILIGLGGSNGVCDLDPCQQAVYDDCIGKGFRAPTEEEHKECMILVSTLPKEQCPNFFKCEKECSAITLGCPPAVWQCSGDQSRQQISCSQNCFKQYKVPRPSWYGY